MRRWPGGGSGGPVRSFGPLPDEPEKDVDEATLWQNAVDALRAKGASLAEAMDGANLVLQAYRRQREELAARITGRRSGQRRRRIRTGEPPEGGETG